MSVQSLVEILEIVRFPKQDNELLTGFNIESPDKSYETDKYEIKLLGWVLGKSSQVVALELISNGVLVQQIPVSQSRPDVVNVYPEIPFAETSGFLTNIAVGDMPEETELLLQAIFSDYNRTPLAKIKFRRHLPFLERVEKELQENSLKLKELQKYLETAQGATTA